MSLGFKKYTQKKKTIEPRIEKVTLMRQKILKLHR